MLCSVLADIARGESSGPIFGKGGAGTLLLGFGSFIIFWVIWETSNKRVAFERRVVKQAYKMFETFSSSSLFSCSFNIKDLCKQK